MSARLRRDGRRTFKQRPGPKPQTVAELEDRDMLIFFHALRRHQKLKDIFAKLKGGQSERGFAKAAITVVDGYVEIAQADGSRRLNLYSATRASGRIATVEQLDATADLVLKKYKKILRDRGRGEDRRFLDRYADTLFDAARPKSAALPDHPVIVTPAGIFGAGAWATKRVEKAAANEAARGEPTWVTAARLGAIAQADGARESENIAQRARDDLKAINFPIDEVLKRLDLLQHYELITKSAD